MASERRNSLPAESSAGSESIGDDDRRRMKRDRESAYGPSTPKGEDDFKVLGGLTPLAKKGRVQTASSNVSDDNANSDTDSLPADDVPSETAAPQTPPPGLNNEAPSAPSTPTLQGQTLPANKGEGKETMNIRRRVEALEWDDAQQQKQNPIAAPASGEDSEIADVAADVAQSAAVVQAKDQEDEDIAEVAGEVASSAQRLDEGERDVEIADVAAEVAESAKVVNQDDAMSVITASEVEDESAVPLTEQEQDVQIASVADEVGVSAAKADLEDEVAALPNGPEVAEVAAEVGQSAALVDARDESMSESAKVSTEVAESAVVAAKEDANEAAEVKAAAKGEDKGPTSLPDKVALPPAPKSFSAFSASASPFASFSSSASPFSAVPSTPTPPPPQQKPKAKTNFTAIPSLSSASSSSASSSTLTSSVNPPSTPRVGGSAAFGASSTTTPQQPSTAKPNVPPPTSPLSRPAAPPSSSTPFSSFASSSGFSIPSSTSGFGSYSAATTASPFAKVQASTALTAPSQTPSRKLGDPVEDDPDKRIFKEQEVVTGEEDDDTIHSVRCKLFVMLDGSWVERGTGVLKLNVTRGSQRRGARLVMRADATHRLLLNSVLFPKFSIELFQEKYVRFAIIEAGEPVSYMLRFGGTPSAQALVSAVQDRVSTLD